MTINLFVSGSTGFVDNPNNSADDSFRKEFSYWGIGSRDNASRYEVMKNGTIGSQHNENSKNIIIGFRNCIYTESELENLAFGLKNAIDLIRSQNGYPNINLFGHSNGGNAIARYLYTYRPTFVDNVLTCATPYNGKALTVKPSAFVQEVSNLRLSWQPNGQIDMFVGKGDTGNPKFPSSVANDGVIATDSGICGQLVYNQNVNVISGAGHTSINTIPQVTQIVKS